VGRHHHFYNVDANELIEIGLGELKFSRWPELPSGTEAQDIEVADRVRNPRV